MNPGLLQLLRVLHVVGGAFWFGATVMMTAFVGPSVEAAGPAGGQVMGQITTVRKLHFWMFVASTTTLLSGLWLYEWRSGGFNGGWVLSTPGLTYTVSGLFALAGSLVGGGMVGRSAKALAALAGAPPPRRVPAPAMAGGAGGAASVPAAAAGATAAAAVPAAAAAPPPEVLRLAKRMKVGSRIATALLTLALLGMAVGRYI